MKNKNCPAYNKNTETTREVIGSASGVPIFKERELILSEYCTVLQIENDFDCDKCVLKFEDNNKK